MYDIPCTNLFDNKYYLSITYKNLVSFDFNTIKKYLNPIIMYYLKPGKNYHHILKNKAICLL